MLLNRKLKARAMRIVRFVAGKQPRYGVVEDTVVREIQGDIFGKFAAIIGPFLVGFTGQMSGDSRYGVLSVLLLFLTGSVILTQVKEVT